MDWIAFISTTVLGGLVFFKTAGAVSRMVDDAGRSTWPVKKGPRDRYSPPREFVNRKGEPWQGPSPSCGGYWDPRVTVRKEVPNR